MDNMESRRNDYLKNFQRNNNLNELFDSETSSHIKNTGNEIVRKLKKEDLTHDEAYASLQYAYNKIKYESNFLKLR